MVKKPESLERIIAEHPFVKDLEAPYLETICGCASNVRFAPGEYIFKYGEPANHFYFLREGTVVLEAFIPEAASRPLQTIGAGEVLGWSWLFPPYQWHYDARVQEAVRAIAFDGKCLRGKCDKDPKFGYEMMKRFARIMSDRLQATRLQIIDVYGQGK